MKQVLWAILALGILTAGTEARAQDAYGAIAFSQSTGAHGYSYDYGSRAAAEQAAMAGCRKHGGGCKVVTWVKNGCTALAVGSRRGYGTAWAANQNVAQRAAVANCARHDGNCSVLRWVCTRR